MSFTIEPDGEATHGACPDCGELTRSIWGYISNERCTRAAYFIRWTDGHIERGAEIMVSIGLWGDQATPADRRCVGLECRVLDNGPGFMVVDAQQLGWSTQELLGAKLSRAEALADPISREIFAMLDQLIAEDMRFAAFLQGGAFLQ